MKSKLITGMAILSILNGCSKQNLVNVPIGEMGYAQGKPIVSQGFVDCSAIILDYSNKSFMVHAIPDGYDGECNPNYINTSNSVNALTSLALSQGINPEECVAIVNSGSKNSLNIILRDLENRKIPILDFNLDKLPRDISYDPLTNKISVTHYSI